MSLATAEAIRDRVIDIVEYIDPILLVGDRFRRYRNEAGGDFRDWAEKNPAAALRRFQVRNVGHDEPPAVSNMEFEERKLVLEILVAYPQNNRAGRDNAMDRDDAIEADWGEIDFNVGICGRGNFAGSYDCTPIGATKEIERSGPVDLLVIRAEFLFLKALTASGGLVASLGLGLGGG